MLQDYLVCRTNETERLDFYSLNSYEWCGSSSSYTISGYNQLQAIAEGYPVPIFLSEDGCNTNPPRDFADQSAIFGTEMEGTFSGAIIYEWIQETNDYGLVSYGPFAGSSVVQGSSVIDGYATGPNFRLMLQRTQLTDLPRWTRQGTPTPVAPDFSNLQGQWATLTPTGTPSSVYAATASSLTRPACPTSGNGWDVDPSAPLPTIGQAGVTQGLPSGIPSGGITSVGTTSTTSAAASATSAKAHNAAGKTHVNVFSSGEAGFMGMLIALMTVGAAVVVWL